MKTHSSLFFRSFAAASALAVFCVATSYSPEAGACGGLFCSTSSPVNQVAERIIFAKNGDGTVTAAIEIQYEGPAAAFAWVLPVPQGEVQIGVSSQQALDALQAASNPLYSLQTMFESCGGDRAVSLSSPSPGAAATAQADGNVVAPNGGVQVVASGNAGPYDYVIIEVDASLTDRADVAVNWLEENEFDISGIGPEVLRVYLEQDMNLLAFRLSKESDSGSIRPVMLTYDGERPMIPIQPTAVAAQDDMGIMVWVLGEGRAVPTNYLSLELNEARIDWLNPNPTYNDVVVAAADEAGGWGFVTEQSGPAESFAESIYSSSKEAQWNSLRTGQFASVQEFLQQAVFVAQAPFTNPGAFGGGFTPIPQGAQELYDGFLEVMSDPAVVPLRQGATASQLVSCVSCYFQVDVPVRNEAYPSTPYVAGEDPLDTLDVQAFIERMDELVIAPLDATRQLFEDNAQVTRLYTTLSPDEMTLDPEFDINPDLEDVPNNHVAERLMHCDGTSWTITLPQGHVVRGNGGTWPIVATESSVLPYNARTLQLSTNGSGEVVIDRYDDISMALADLGVGAVDPASPVAQERGTVGLHDNDDSGCAIRSASAAGTSASWWLLVGGLFGAGLSLRSRWQRS